MGSNGGLFEYDNEPSTALKAGDFLISSVNVMCHLFVNFFCCVELVILVIIVTHVKADRFQYVVHIT
jgi:hypothetical protein